MNALCSLVLVLGLVGRAFAAFYSLGSTDGNEAVRGVSPTCFSSSRVIAPGGDSCCLAWLLPTRAEKKANENLQRSGKIIKSQEAFLNKGKCGNTLSILKNENSEFTVFMTFQDDAGYTLYNAAKADLKSGGAAKNQIQYFARRVVVGAMNRMVWKRNNNPSTFADCNPGAADNQAKASFVQLFYDDDASALKLEFKVIIPMYWVAATTVTQCAGPHTSATIDNILGQHGKKSSPMPQGIVSWNPTSHTPNPGSIVMAMSENVFYSGKNGDMHASQRDLLARQAIVDEATQLRGMTGPVVSQLVRALNPRTPAKRDVVSYLRGLLLKSGKPAKVTASGVVGNAVIKRGP
jgi:hypothetical protein